MYILYTAAAALAGALLFDRMKVPAGAMVGAMTAVGALRLANVRTLDMPPAGRFLAFVVIGWLLGESIDRALVRELADAAIPIGIAVVTLLLFSGLLAFGLAIAGGLDKMTAFLAVSPGGLSQMSALALDVRANPGIVVAIHTLRVVTIALLAPVLVRWLTPS